MSTRPVSGSTSAVLSVMIQLPPTAYIAITGTAPTWARIWLTAYITAWLLATVAIAGRNKDGAR
ncbi:hypothetical protein [Kitasatospora sp. NPDC058478]|uniref:hypothetical protein n=1 Tax=unclassified Kitasatospora TaxID=2633591 RepID=UPI0036539DFC